MKRLTLAGILAGASLLLSQPGPPQRPGPVPGGFLLPTGWTIRPAGAQFDLDTLPMASLATPDGKFVLVLHGGHRPPSIWVLDARTLRRVATVPLPDAWLGMALTPNGRLLYVGGASKAEIYEFSLSPEGELNRLRTFPAVAEADRTPRHFIGDVQLTPDGRLIYAADLYQNQVVVINPSSGRVIERFKTGRRPYRILFHPDGKSYFVSSWADASVHQHETDTGRQLNFVRLGHHPTDMLWREKQPGEDEDTGDNAPRDPFNYKARLFVATANTNSIQVLGVSESKELRRIESANAALYARQPLGMTPSALALSPDGKRLLAACSDANAVAVFDVSTRRATLAGFLPAGWYPTAVRALPDGRTLVLNGKGPYGHGTLSAIDPFDEATLDGHTRTVRANTPFREPLLERAHDAPPGHPIPAQPGEKSPIEHVVYIVKDNATHRRLYDGAAAAQAAPNHHKLGLEFVRLENFHAPAETLADGLNWASAAIVPDYVEKLWPSTYASRRRHDDFEGGDPAALPPAGYLWNQVLSAGIPMRSYGVWTANKPKAEAGGVQIETVRDPALRPVTNLLFRGPDPQYLDTDRARFVLADLAKWESDGAMPRFIQIRLAGDREKRPGSGGVTPRAALADNDYALGMLIEAFSRSKFWPKMAVLVVQASASDAPGRAAGTRAPAYVISPYANHGASVQTFYTNASALRTIELILGLNPMTHYDAAARPMTDAFRPVPERKTYTAEKPRVPLDERDAR